MATISRRQLLLGLAAMPGVVHLACSSDKPSLVEQAAEIRQLSEATVTPTPEPPFIVPRGEEERLMMAGTPYETPLYIFGSGEPGQIVMVLGGVHGNEPGGWLAAEAIVESIRPESGALLVIPKANIVATSLFERTTEALADLNRSYPGTPGGKPMEVMAGEIVQVLRDFRSNVVLDLHESWAFYNERTQNGTAFLGQTVTTYPEEPGRTLGQNIVDGVNTRIHAPIEELFFRDRFGSGTMQMGGGIRNSTSSLGLPRWLPGLSAILVEMGQQQELDRRVALHVEVVKEAMNLLQMS